MVHGAGLMPTLGDAGAVACAWGSDRRLVELSLDHNSLEGRIPPLHSFRQLQVLQLGYNRLTGGLPSVAALGKLRVLGVQHNALSGPLPPSINQLTQLTHARASLGHVYERRTPGRRCRRG